MLTNNTKYFCGPQRLGMLLNTDGTALVRWAEHFSTVLTIKHKRGGNCKSVSSWNESVPCCSAFYWGNQKNHKPPLISKAPGSEAIPAEIYKAGGLCLVEKLTNPFQSLWKLEAIPQEFKDASERQDNWQACDNHRGISLLSVAGKICGRNPFEPTNCLHRLVSAAWESVWFQKRLKH